VGVGIGALSMVLALNIAKIMIKKMKILPKGLKGTFLKFQNGQVSHLKSAVPSIGFHIAQLVQCRYLPQRRFIMLDHHLERVR
jgi:hypothetical protein